MKQKQNKAWSFCFEKTRYLLYMLLIVEIGGMKGGFNSFFYKKVNAVSMG